MADQETRRRDFSRLAVIFTGVGESAHVLEGGMSAIEHVQLELGCTGRTARCDEPQTHEQERHRRRIRSLDFASSCDGFLLNLIY